MRTLRISLFSLTLVFAGCAVYTPAASYRTGAGEQPAVDCSEYQRADARNNTLTAVFSLGLVRSGSTGLEDMCMWLKSAHERAKALQNEALRIQPQQEFRAVPSQ